MYKKDYKHIFSFRKFVIVKELSYEDQDEPDYYIYGRVGLFCYIKLTYVDDVIWKEMYEFEKD